ncbi:GNAT family N-acetyltransferase [Gammaproteobacteria bacterium]|nr:GNAT family N-acetyltransferase [Gammaproteobacteria bacterium]
MPNSKLLNVSLREITAETVGKIIRLDVEESQRRFVASNAISLAQALFAPDAWFRAIYSDEEPAGFVMLSDESASDPVPEAPEIMIWRFMIDKNYQNRGIGRQALHLVVDQARRRKIFSCLYVSFVPGEGSPEGFYTGFGFEPTGAVEDGEVILKIEL